MPFSRGYQFTGGLLILYTMPKRIIFTEIDSNVGSEIEMFTNEKGNVIIVIKYEGDAYADARVIELNTTEFREMISIINKEIEANIFK